MNILLFLAILPVILLCTYVYKKDVNREPFGLLMKIFFLGVLMALPVVFAELIVGIFLKTEGITNFVILFINVFLSVAIIEEAAKWVVAKFIGYEDKECDEVYDILVYSVFASLGFACIENILYVIQMGIGVAITRALLSVPGHMCFGVLMGYYLGKAKIALVNGDMSKKKMYMFLSLLVPALFHTMYDTLLFFEGEDILFVYFLIFDIGMVIYCFYTVRNIAKMQVNIRNGVYPIGGVINNNQVNSINTSGVVNNAFSESTVCTNTNSISSNASVLSVNPSLQSNNNVKRFCPICGYSVEGKMFCSNCGNKVN